MTPAQKRHQTVKKKYGSYSRMLREKRDVSNLILGGYNGGIKRGRKGTATWEKEKLQAMVQARERDSRGRFLPGSGANGSATRGDVHRDQHNRTNDVQEEEGRSTVQSTYQG